MERFPLGSHPAPPPPCTACKGILIVCSLGYLPVYEGTRRERERERETHTARANMHMHTNTNTQRKHTSTSGTAMCRHARATLVNAQYSHDTACGWHARRTGAFSKIRWVGARNKRAKGKDICTAANIVRHVVAELPASYVKVGACSSQLIGTPVSTPCPTSFLP